MTTITFHVGDVRDVLATLPDSSVDLVVTSPPFLALRSYLPADHPDKHREIGSEATPAGFLDTMLGLTADWRRVVADWGSIAVEIGDTYSGSGGAGGDYNEDGLRAGQQKFSGSAARRGRLADYTDGRGNPDGMRDATFSGANTRTGGGPGWPLAKSLCGIPTLYTWSLAYGRNLLTGQPSPAGQWRIRNLLTWTRPNPPVGALGDKFRPATSFVTVACTSDKRWFDLDAVRGEVSDWTRGYADRYPVSDRAAMAAATPPGQRSASSAVAGNTKGNGIKQQGAPPLDWWDANDLDPDEIADWQPLHRLPTQPYKGSHYATYPIALPRRLIEAMCPREVCRVCGEPRRRITTATYTPHGERRQENKGVRGFGVVNGEHAQHMTHGRATKNVDTLGWTDCGHDNYRPGIVLDPFGGSGTTAIAAALTGRDALLIDIDRRNVDLTRQRLTEHCHITSEAVDGDTITWTVTPATPTELAARAAGQPTLFEDA